MSEGTARDEGDGRITAVIPTYNRAGLVGRAIDSALSQSHAPDDVIVVDDGSTDDTGTRIEAYGSQVRYVRQENGGDAVARNTGVSAATSTWIAFLDSDDAWADDHLARLHRAMTATSGQAGFYFADTLLAPYDGGDPTQLWEDAGFSIETDHELAQDATSWALLRIQPMMLQSSMFNRAAFLGVGGLLPRVPPRADTHLFYAMSLGRPACAVAGTGAIMSADDPSTRLTAVHSEKTAGYWTSSIRLYRDLLQRELPLSDDTVRFFKSAEAVAHWRLARLGWSTRDLRVCASHLGPSLRLDPRAFASRFLARAR